MPEDWKQVIGSKFKIEKDYQLKKRIERLERQIKTLSLKKKAPHL